ncbi:MAG TPA: PucR family transcriptional regulator, partial [Pseudonocardiaceae bacterium]|nr:PucR family transcriptional regulator [Pseudonocardiaceae bacterium]
MTVQTGTRPLSASTLRRLALASGGLATASVAEMELRFPWFRRLPADQRAGILLVTQTSVANFVEWLKDPRHSIKLSAGAFRAAPRDLSRWISLRQTVDLVRIATSVFEQQLPELAADDAERALLTEASLRYSREVAFAAASAYAGAAEARGAWDARLEALIVDGIMRGDGEESLLSHAAALGLEPAAPATVLVGNPPPDGAPELLADIRSVAVRAGRGVLVGVQGSRLVLVVSGCPAPPDDGHWMIDAFGAGPVV